MNKKILRKQEIMCDKYGVKWIESPDSMKVGISKNIKEGKLPINGMRHPISGDTTGWYIWGGEDITKDKDFFVPLHVNHLEEWCPQVLKYLGLPPGSRFQIADNYEDVWTDKSLLIA
ncbi:MAG: hypothetical protein WCV83_00960 [Candidatus Magasanikbacteria bacterium]